MQKGQLQRTLKQEDGNGETQGEARKTRNCCNGDKYRRGKGKGELWMRAPHATRGSTKNLTQAIKNTSDPVETVLHVYESDPETHAEAMRNSKADDWRKVMVEEIQALEDNNVWNVIKRPVDANLLHIKWVFQTKIDANGASEDSTHNWLHVGMSKSSVFTIRLPSPL